LVIQRVQGAIGGIAVMVLVGLIQQALAKK
jgi:hypothetical protein